MLVYLRTQSDIKRDRRVKEILGGGGCGEMFEKNYLKVSSIRCF